MTADPLPGMPEGGEERARLTADMVARRSYGKLVALLAARTRDLAAAEDALSEAFAAALADWPRKGVPSNPEAWLLTVARRKLIDAGRRRRSGEAASGQLRLLAEGTEAAESRAEIPDYRLALMFACAHPEIEPGIRAPLMLQVVLGMDARTIASALLMSPAAMGKRLVRAKNRIREAGIPFAIPERDELSERLTAVLDAIYAAYSEGWGDPGKADVVRSDLTGEAIFLARLVNELLPGQPEAMGLLAFMLHADARSRARRSAEGEYVPLEQQDPDLWNWEMIAEAEDLIRRIAAVGGIGRYRLEAALQSAHVHRRHSGEANWEEVLRLYDALVSVTGSPVVAVNRAPAVAELRGARAALESLEHLAGDPRMTEYQPYWAVRAELLARAGAAVEARHAFDIAIGLERDPAVRRFLQRRQATLGA